MSRHDSDYETDEEFPDDVEFARPASRTAGAQDSSVMLHRFPIEFSRSFRPEPAPLEPEPEGIQPELRAPANERPRQRPVLVLETIEVGQNLAVDELVGGLRNQPMLVGEFLRREWIFRCRVLEQPPAALS